MRPIKIPYSALRFSNNEIQTWGINFHRNFRETRERYTWNFVDRTIGATQQYSGDLTGIKNINPPTRLSFSPYASAAYENYDGENSFDKNIGLDVKYGISESFTLDATLIPDFGQTAFDDTILNLGPFEQQYQEQRPFFTEGVELFTKGNLFYTRRIGDQPIDYYDSDDLAPNEELIENPTNVNMLNAIKVSGRTDKGLGIGVFNAITEETFAKIKNLDTDEIWKVTTEPLANYSVIVLDQQFNKNSFISLINTNVLRNGSVRDANVTGFLFDLNNKQNTYKISGEAKMSNIRENGSTTKGHLIGTEIGKTFGQFQYAIGYEMADENYDINDLGYQRFQNYHAFSSRAIYQIFEPKGVFRNYRINADGNMYYRYSNGAYIGNSVEVSFFGFLEKQIAFRIGLDTALGDQYDYYEPRVDDRYFITSTAIDYDFWVSTNFNKRFAFEIRGYYDTRVQDDFYEYNISVEPRFRFSDKFSMIYEFDYVSSTNDRGYVEELADGTIIFGARDRTSITNSISSKYNFNTKSSLALAFRYYWSPVQYEDQYYSLNMVGTLDPHPYSENNDINYNIWNLDLSYAWEFAPGSQMVALYRNSIFNSDDLSYLDFKDNLNNLFEQPKQHIISLKLIYYIDYNSTKSWLKKS